MSQLNNTPVLRVLTVNTVHSAACSSYVVYRIALQWYRIVSCTTKQHRETTY